MFVGRYPLMRFSSSGGNLPLPMCAQTAVTPQKRCLEVARQTDEDFLRRAKLTQGPPKAAEVRRCLHRHLLAKQSAQKGDAFRQNFARSPDVSLLKHGGGRRSRISARRSESLVHQLLEAAYLDAARGQHVGSNHAPRMAAFWADVSLALDLLGAFDLGPLEARKGSVPPELSLSGAPGAILRRAGPIRSV